MTDPGFGAFLLTLMRQKQIDHEDHGVDPLFVLHHQRASVGSSLFRIQALPTKVRAEIVQVLRQVYGTAIWVEAQVVEAW